MSIEKFLKEFNYEIRNDMKISARDTIELIKQNKAILIDVRFKEEYETWHINPSINIPLNELPFRLEEIKQGKLIITACPHSERAAMAMAYLRSKGIYAKYLSDGLLALADILKGDEAKKFMEALKDIKNN